MSTPAHLQEARSKRTAPARLRDLAVHLDPEIRQAARGNPRCPSDINQLLDLAEEHPEHLTAAHLDALARLGPYGVLLSVQHPEVSDDTLISLVQAGHLHFVLEDRSDHSADWIMRQAEHRPALLRYLCADAGVPWPLRRRAWKMRKAQKKKQGLTELENVAAPDPASPDPAAKPSPDQNPPEVEVTPEEVRRKLRERQGPVELLAEEIALIQADVKLQRLAARHPYLPVPLLGWIDREQPHGQARETLLNRLEAHALEPELFTLLAQRGEWDIRAAMGRNPHLPDAVRRQLGHDEDWWVRAAVAENPETQPDELTALAQDHDHVTVREHVAAHPHTPGDVLLRLAQDGDPAVRSQVARNPSAPPETLALLAEDERYATREAAAAHALSSPETLARLRSDRHERVRYVAGLRTDSLDETRAQEALATRRRNVRLALSHARSTPVPVLEQLARDRHPDVRAQVALHHHVPEGVRRALLDDASAVVRTVALASDEETPSDRLAFLPRHDARLRQALSRNAHTPEAILEELSEDPVKEIRLSVVLNPSAPGSALERRLPEQPLRPDIRRHPRYEGEVQRKLRQIEEQEASHPDATPEALEALSQSDSPGVRARVARHPNSPEALLHVLAASYQEERVRRAVAERPGTLSEDLQQHLARDESADIRRVVAYRPGLPESVMLILAQTSADDEALLSSLLENQEPCVPLLELLAHNISTDLRMQVARHRSTPLKTLLELAQDPHEDVHKALLRNRQLDAAALLQLVHHARLRLRIAQHPRADGAVLEALAYDARYHRYLKLQAWIKRMPFAEHPWSRQWQASAKRRASGRAYKDLAVLRAVVEHLAATPKAVQYAQRLRHPDMDKVLKQRQERLAAPSSSPSLAVPDTDPSGEPHD